MYVCVCNGVSDKDLKNSYDKGATSVSELQMSTGCGTCCGTCLQMVDDLVKEWGPSVPFEPVLTMSDPVSKTSLNVNLFSNPQETKNQTNPKLC